MQPHYKLCALKKFSKANRNNKATEVLNLLRKILLWNDTLSKIHVFAFWNYVKIANIIQITIHKEKTNSKAIHRSILILPARKTYICVYMMRLETVVEYSPPVRKVVGSIVTSARSDQGHKTSALWGATNL